MRRSTLVLAAAISAAALTVPAVAGAGTAPGYPAPENPAGGEAKPKGPFRTLRVSKRADGAYRTIQRAVNAARPGDTIRVADGTYREGLIVRGASKRYVKLLGNATKPERVVLEGQGLRGRTAQNGVWVNGAAGVMVRGFKARNFRSNGFLVTNQTGYTFDELIAERDGAYGLYAFNTKGGTISDSLAYFHNNAGFYVGQTPPQPRPVRTIVRNVTSWGNVIGFSGTNMRYVTITGSEWFNNGIGIVPNALDSEKYAPPEENVIRDNDIYWNNFNYYAGAPFTLRRGVTGKVDYPVGTGLLLFGGRGHIVEGNRFFGNYLVGAGALQQLLLEQKDAADLRRNEMRDNAFGLDGTDANGRDLFYDGNGTGNCFSGNTGVVRTVPADGSTFAPCPFTGANAFNSAAQGEAVGWALEADREKFWVRVTHPAREGITPLERFQRGRVYGPTK